MKASQSSTSRLIVEPVHDPLVGFDIEAKASLDPSDELAVTDRGDANRGQAHARGRRMRFGSIDEAGPNVVFGYGRSIKHAFIFGKYPGKSRDNSRWT